MGKGSKVCSSCQFSTGPRALTCPKCQHPFKFKDGTRSAEKVSGPTVPSPLARPKQETKPKGKRKKIAKVTKKKDYIVVPLEDWRDLNKGDIIDVSGGPYYMNWDNWDAEKLKKIPLKKMMGYKGLFRVISLDSDGISGFSLDEGGFGYIYMGPPKHQDGIDYEAHNIELVERKE